MKFTSIYRLDGLKFDKALKVELPEDVRKHFKD